MNTSKANLHNCQMELKEWVRAARKHKGWTLAQLGEVVGRSKSNVGLWESGMHSPSYAQIEQIAAETGFPPPNLLEVQPDGSIKTTSRAGDGFTRSGEIFVYGEATVEDSVYTEVHVLEGGALQGITADDCYAVKIKGDGAAPLVKHDQFIVVKEKGRPAFGDLCIVSVELGPTRLLEFLSERDDAWSMASLAGKRLTIEKDSVTSFDSVVAVASQTLWRPKLS